MRLDDERESSNVDDRRGFGMGGTGLKVGGGIGTIVIILIALFFGVDPTTLLNLAGDSGAPSQTQSQPAPNGGQVAGNEDSQRRFVSRILASTEDVWTDIFRQNGRQYVDPTLVLFSGTMPSACGTASAAVGPFYCPSDHKVYLDTAFFRDMQTKLGAGSGDFARAYVIAHEVGHHVQTLLGLTDKVQALRARADESQANALSVRVELQADCLAGVWANHADATQHILDQGDIAQGLNAAAAIDDDRLQQRAQGYVEPDSFTHGSSAQRVGWFKRGLQTGDLQQCDTFASVNP